MENRKNWKTFYTINILSDTKMNMSFNWVHDCESVVNGSYQIHFRGVFHITYF